jgi:hypothetical protein
MTWERWEELTGILDAIRRQSTQLKVTEVEEERKNA